VGASLDRQLSSAQHDPTRQILLEIYSGHGNSEEYRAWRGVATDAAGAPHCPEPSDDYLPCCWQAGEIIRSRCADPASAECELHVAEARDNFLRGGSGGYRTVTGATVEDWLDCGQCVDCFAPAFDYRPALSAQYALARTAFDDEAGPQRFRFGFIGSSDTQHQGIPGTSLWSTTELCWVRADSNLGEPTRRRALRSAPALPAGHRSEIPRAFEACMGVRSKFWSDRY
jgi:hypothetical protein